LRAKDQHKVAVKHTNPREEQDDRMEPEVAVIASLRRAVEALPDDLALRLHLASMLLDAGQRDESIRHLGAIVHVDPANTEALGLLQRAASRPASDAQAAASGVPADRAPAGTAQAGGAQAERTQGGTGPGHPGGDDLIEVDPGEVGPTDDGPAGGAARARDDLAVSGSEEHDEALDGGASARGTADSNEADSGTADGNGADGNGADSGAATRKAAGSDPATGDGGFDWAEAETELREVMPPMFVTADGAAAEEPDGGPGAYDAEQPGLRLADVAGMTEVKARLEAAFLAPLRNPDLRRLYHKNLRGGLMLYGPPGCGKTFIARAVAGELGAHFLAVSFADIIDMFIGQSERNIRELFTIARDKAPCVLFLDEVDAIGQKRSQLRNTPMRSAVNQLLLELDDVSGGNEGVFVLAASNHPWDVDSALRRPGRFDRTLLVLPPDAAAREAVFRFHLRERPVAGIELPRLAALTDGYSAADIAHVCESAAELALLDSARRGEVRMIGQSDLASAVSQVRPSIGPWFDSARNVALYANEGGAYDDLVAYLKKRKML
jgi:AAA+ superfamily predicted ATPase